MVQVVVCRTPLVLAGLRGRASLFDQWARHCVGWSGGLLVVFLVILQMLFPSLLCAVLCCTAGLHRHHLHACQHARDQGQQRAAPGWCCGAGG